ncbi:MAG: hypothetical protein ACRCY9_13110 [Phycicoccus sp.]
MDETLELDLHHVVRRGVWASFPVLDGLRCWQPFLDAGGSDDVARGSKILTELLRLVLDDWKNTSPRDAEAAARLLDLGSHRGRRVLNGPSGLRIRAGAVYDVSWDQFRRRYESGLIEEFAGYLATWSAAPTIASLHCESATSPALAAHGPVGVAEEARQASRFARRVGGAAMSRSALDRIRLEVRGFAADYVSQPLAGLLVEIRELRAEVFGLVEASRSPDQMRDLYLEACRLGGLVAHACLDLGHYRAARVHAQTAFLCAEMAGHDGMRAWVRGFQSLAAYWDGNLSEAVRFAQDGAQYGAAGSVGARLACLEARACAALGDKSGALAALARAEQVRNLIGHDDSDVGVFTFPAAKQAVYTGTTLLAFGDCDTVARAARESSRALALYDAAPPAQRSSGDILAAQLDLGRGYLRQDDLDGLTEHLRVVLVVPEARRTASIVKRAAGIAASLAAPRYKSLAQSRQVRAEIASFCAPSRARSPQWPV